MDATFDQELRGGRPSYRVPAVDRRFTYDALVASERAVRSCLAEQAFIPIRLTIAAGGILAAAEAEISDPAARACVLSLLREVRFPDPGERMTYVVHYIYDRAP